MYDVTTDHKRIMGKISDEFAEVGGLISIFFTGGAIFYAIIGGPIKDVDFATNFQDLTRNV